MLGLTVLLTVAVRVRLRDMPLERDEGEYAYAGQLALHGVPPYKEAYNMKLPGTYIAYAIIMALFGQNPSAIHFGVALVNAACIVLVFLLGRKLMDEVTGAVAAMSFGLLSLSPSVLGLAGHATHFVLLPALGGILLLTVATSRSQPQPSPHLVVSWSYNTLVFLSGILFGLAFLMKQHGIFFSLFGASYLLAQANARSGARERLKTRPAPIGTKLKTLLARSSRSLLLFSAGCVLPYLATCLVLLGAGVFRQFVFWTVTYAAKYASQASLVNGPELLKAGVQAVIGPNLVLWLLPWAGALVMWWEERLEGPKAQDSSRSERDKTQDSRLSSPRFFLISLLFCSIASTSVGLYFRGHYFILVLPALALLTGVAVSRALHLVRHDRSIELFLAAAILALFVVGIGAALIGNGSVWFAMSPTQASRDIYRTTLFSEAVKASDFLKANTTSQTRIAVLGSEPEIYFYARRRSASGYIYMYPLMEKHDLALRMQEEFIAEIERAKPEYVVYVEDNYSWLANPNSERRLDGWWRAYWAKNLDLALTIDFDPALETGVDEEAGAPIPKTRSHMFVLKRR